MIKKKIGLKLLYVFLMCFASLLLSLLLFPVSSSAASEYAVDKVVSDIYSNLGITESNFNASVFLDYWNGVKITYPYAFAYTNSNKTYVRYYMVGDGSVDASKIYYDDGSIYISHNTGQEFPSTPTSVSGGSSGNFPLTSSSYFGNYDDYTTPAIDWDNPFYSANIPNPNIYVSYRNLNSTPVIDVPLNVSVSSFPVGQNVTEYYVQMFALVNMDFNYYVQNTRDGIVYNGLDMEKWTTYFDVVTPQDFKVASDLSEDYIHLALTNGWYNNYPQDSSFNFSFADGIPSNLQLSAITKFHNFRKNATFADNTVYLYVRYFTIDEDNNFVVGAWTVWKSYNPNEFYAELPTYYVPYNIVPGTQGTSSNVTPVSTASPEPSVIVNPVNTNPGVNITVTQNVPNYPDYPTIASYNKDNLLVDTMNQLNSIQGFFGEFGSFLVTAFAFMPAWIWAIIGVGFSLSIVVMFLKIL